MKRREFLQTTGAGALALASRRISASPVNDSGKLTLFLGGDVMTGRGIDRILPHPSGPVPGGDPANSAERSMRISQEASESIVRKVDFDYVWGDALGVLDSEGPDFRIVNLETPVTSGSERWPGKSYSFRMNPENVPVLQAARIDCCALANNHVLDFMYQGLNETLEVLNRAEIQSAGAGGNIEEAGAAAVFDIPGSGNLRVYSFADSHSGPPSDWAAQEDRPGINHVGWLDSSMTRRVQERISAEKEPGDLVVASIHWGGNWGYDISREQRVFARRLILAGADVIHGHSSHHVKAIEIYNDRPIIYGAGDLINDYGGRANENNVYRGELTLLYFVTLDIATGRLDEMRLVPMRIRNFRLQHASEDEAQWLGQMMNRQGERFGTGVREINRAFELHWGAATS